nr:hypothetical protein [uncultured Acetatifactor sp.]
MGKIKNPDVRFPGHVSGLVSGFWGSIGFNAFIGGMFAAVRRFFLSLRFWAFVFGALISGLWFWVFGFLFGISFMGFLLSLFWIWRI